MSMETVLSWKVSAADSHAPVIYYCNILLAANAP